MDFDWGAAGQKFGEGGEEGFKALNPRFIFQLVGIVVIVILLLLLRDKEP